MAKLKKCAHCGKMFKPEKAAQTYCSLECAEAAIAKQKQWNDILTPVANVLELEYLTFSKAATLMGCSRQYVYKLVAEGKLPASRLSNRMSFIKREDIEKMLQGNPYYRVLPVGLKRKNKETIQSEDVEQAPSFDSSKYISLEEAMAKYSVSNTTIYNNVKSGNVQVCRIAGKTYYDKGILDEVMNQNKQSRSSSSCSTTSSSVSSLIVKDEDIEWLMVNDCANLYHKTPAAMKTFVYRYEIPARWIDGKRYYSKNHLDALLTHRSEDNKEYYTISQLYNIFGIKKATATTFCQQHGIRMVKQNKRNLFLKEDVDKLMSKRE